MINRSDLPLDPEKRSQKGLQDSYYESLVLLPYRQAKGKLLYEFNHNYIGARLSISGGNITQAECSMDCQALQQIMKGFSIDPESFR